MQSYKPNNNHPLSRQSQRWVGVSNRISKYSVFTLILLTSVNLFAEGVLKNTPTPAEIQAEFTQAMADLDSGRPAIAAVSLERLVELTASPRILLELGRALYLSGQYKKSKAVFNQVLQSDEIPWLVEENVRHFLSLIEQRTGSISFNLAFISDTNPTLKSSAKQYQSIFGLISVPSTDEDNTIYGLNYSLSGQKPLTEDGLVSGSVYVSVSDYPGALSDSINYRVEIKHAFPTKRMNYVNFGIESGFKDDKRTFQLPYMGLHFGHYEATKSWSLNFKRGYMNVESSDYQDGVRDTIRFSLTNNLKNSRQLTSSVKLYYSDAEYDEDRFGSIELGERYGFKVPVRQSRVEVFGNAEYRKHDGVNFFFQDVREDHMATVGVDLIGKGFRVFGLTPRLGVSYVRNESSLPYYAYDKSAFQLSVSM